MAGYKALDFAERTASARAAKQRALDLMRVKPAPDEALLAARREASEAADRLEAERRAAKRAAATEAKAAAKAAADEHAAAAAAPASPAGPETTMSEAEQKAVRDARYAARKERRR